MVKVVLILVFLFFLLMVFLVNIFEVWINRVSINMRFLGQDYKNDKIVFCYLFEFQNKLIMYYFGKLGKQVIF